MPLPVPLTSFIGREREIETVRRLLDTSRLITLTGAGGSGKTRLALEVARATAVDGREVAWAELAALAEPELVAAQVARAVGIRELGSGSVTELLVGALGERVLLLVLDNCEHLVECCAALAELLLRRCPGVRILASSREALGVEGERSWLVPALSLPSNDAAQHAGSAASAEAVRLFVDRARDALASFELSDANADAIARLCRRLDGLPLAIELAAARVRVLTPEQISARLDESFGMLVSRTRGVPTRHQTLRATVDWSYQLLSRAEQALLQRLAVFAGGFTLDAVEAVCEGEFGAAELLDLLTALIDKSLVVMRESAGVARFVLLELVRQYAMERLSKEPEHATAVRWRHAEFFTRLAEAHVRAIERASVEGTLPAVESEEDNFRAVLGWTLQREASDQAHALGVRLVSALWWFWGHRAQYDEARAWLDAARRWNGRGAPLEADANVLTGAGAIAYVHGDIVGGRSFLEQSLTLWERIASAEGPGRALTLRILAHLLGASNELAAAQARAAEALKAARASGARWVVAQALVGAATELLRAGEVDAAVGHLHEAELLARHDEYPIGEMDAARELASIALRGGDVAAAAAHVGRAARACLRAGHPFNTVRLLITAAAVALAVGDAARATRLLGAMDALRGDTRAPLLLVDRPVHDGVRKGVREALGAEAFEAELARGRTLPLADALTLASEIGAGPSTGTLAAAGATNSTTALRTSASTALPALVVSTLGPLEIRVRGEPLRHESLRSARPRDVLLYLLCYPNGRTREQLGLVFWPELSAAQVKNNFHVALHRLRQTLDLPDLIVFEDDRYRINWALGVEFDAARFERELPAALRRANSPDGAGPLEDVLTLFRGDFLEDLTVGDWHLEPRDRLRRLWADGMLRLGELHAEADRHAVAADAFRRLVLREELHEEAYRGLMRALTRAGQRTDALRAYERLASLLRTDLDAEPEPETIALHNRIRQGATV